MDYDLIIVGAGMFGSSAAKHLRKRHPELRVAIIGPDHNDSDLARGQHYDEARICRRVEVIPHWANLVCDGVASIAETEKESGISFYTPCGVVWIGHEDDRRNVATCMQAMEAVVPAGIRPAFVYRDGGATHPANGDAANATVEVLRTPEEVEKIFDHTISVSQFAATDGSPTYYIADHGTGSGGTVHPTNYVLAQLKIAANVEPKSNYTHVNEVVVAVSSQEDGSTTSYVVKTDKGTVLHAPRVIVAAAVFSLYHHLVPDHVAALVTPSPEHVILLRVKAPHASMAENVAAVQKLPSIISMTGSDEDECYALPPRYYADKKGWFIKMGGFHAGIKEGDVSCLEAALEWYKGHQEIAPESLQHLRSMLSTIYPSWKIVEGETDAESSLPNLYVVRCIWDITEGSELLIDAVDGKSWVCCLGGNGRGAKACDTIGDIAAYRAMGDALPAHMQHYDSQFRVPPVKVSGADKQLASIVSPSHPAAHVQLADANRSFKQEG